MQIISLTDIAKQQSAQWKQKWKCEWRYWTIFLKYKQHWAAMRDGCAHLRPYIAKIRIVAFISLAQLKFTKHYNWKKTTFSNHDLWQRQTRLIAAFFVVIVILFVSFLGSARNGWNLIECKQHLIFAKCMAYIFVKTHVCLEVMNHQINAIFKLTLVKYCAKGFYENAQHFSSTAVHAYYLA